MLSKESDQRANSTFTVTHNENGNYTLSWQAGRVLRVVPSTNPSHIHHLDGAGVSGEGKANIAFNASGKIYFHVFDGNKKVAIVSDRRVALKGIRNCRDLGGYIGDSGRPTRWGMLYRSGELSKFCTTDQLLWQSLNVGLIIDFRSIKERTRSPTDIQSNTNHRISVLEIDAGNTTKVIKGLQDGMSSPTSIYDLMLDFNRHFVLEQSATFAAFFDLVATQNKGVLFHCSAGKDRTGFAAAMLLSALGVSYEQIMKDYLLTRHYFIPEQFYHTDFPEHFTVNVPLENIKPLLEVNTAYLNAAFETIKNEYGTVDNYLTKALGVTPAMRKTLQSHYLQR